MNTITGQRATVVADSIVHDIGKNKKQYRDFLCQDVADFCGRPLTRELSITPYGTIGVTFGMGVTSIHSKDTAMRVTDFPTTLEIFVYPVIESQRGTTRIWSERCLLPRAEMRRVYRALLSVSDSPIIRAFVRDHSDDGQGIVEVDMLVAVMQVLLVVRGTMRVTKSVTETADNLERLINDLIGRTRTCMLGQRESYFDDDYILSLEPEMREQITESFKCRGRRETVSRFSLEDTFPNNWPGVLVAMGSGKVTLVNRGKGVTVPKLKRGRQIEV